MPHPTSIVAPLSEVELDSLNVFLKIHGERATCLATGLSRYALMRLLARASARRGTIALARIGIANIQLLARAS